MREGRAIGRMTEILAGGHGSECANVSRSGTRRKGSIGREGLGGGGLRNYVVGKIAEGEQSLRIGGGTGRSGRIRSRTRDISRTRKNIGFGGVMLGGG